MNSSNFLIDKCFGLVSIFWLLGFNLVLIFLVFDCRSGGGDGIKVRKQEDSSPSLPSGIQGLGMGLPDLKSKKKGKQKVASNGSHAAEALDKLREQTREAVKGLESATAPKPDDLNMEDWVKQFEELAGSQVNFALYNSFSYSSFSFFN